MPSREEPRLNLSLTASLAEHLHALHRPGRRTQQCWRGPSTPHPVPTRATVLPLPFRPQQAPEIVDAYLPASSQQDWMDRVLLLILKAASWPLPVW